MAFPFPVRRNLNVPSRIAGKIKWLDLLGFIIGVVFRKTGRKNRTDNTCCPSCFSCIRASGNVRQEHVALRAAFNQAAEHCALTDQVPLSHHFVQCFRTDFVRQRLTHAVIFWSTVPSGSVKSAVFGLESDSTSDVMR